MADWDPTDDELRVLAESQPAPWDERITRDLARLVLREREGRRYHDCLKVQEGLAQTRVQLAEAEAELDACAQVLERRVADLDQARPALADAWDEGWQAATDSALTGTHFEDHPNPYRAAIAGDSIHAAADPADWVIARAKEIEAAEDAGYIECNGCGNWHRPPDLTCPETAAGGVNADTTPAMDGHHAGGES